MGTPVEPIEYGNDCEWCFSISRTPKIIRATFSGIENCPGKDWLLPNNKVFILNQSPENPCSWYNFDATDLTVHYWRGEGFAALNCTNMISPGCEVFFGTTDNPCDVSFVNQYTCETGETTDGVGHVWFEPDNWPEVLANEYNFCPNPGTLFDRTPSTDGGQVIKLANRTDKSNVLIKIPPCLP
jgi:hypothetical protein